MTHTPDIPLPSIEDTTILGEGKNEIPSALMVEAMETLFRSKAKFEFAGTEQIEILARDIAAAILAERERCVKIAATWKGHPADFHFVGKQIADAIRVGA